MGSVRQGAMQLTREQVSKMVADNAPVFYLHPADQYLPCTAEYYLQNSSLWLTPPGARSPTEGDKLLIPLGDVTAASIVESQNQYPPAQLQLRLNPSARNGFPLDKIDDAPLYCNAKAVVGPDGMLEAYEINYLTFYNYNGPYPVFCFEVGAHDADWEHLTIRLHADTSELQGVWYSSHRPRDGQWVPAGQVKQTPGGRIIAYSALHGHGCYPNPGTIVRGYGFANDYAAAGPLWQPRRMVLLPLVEGLDSLPARDRSSPAGRDLASAPPKPARATEQRGCPPVASTGAAVANGIGPTSSASISGDAGLALDLNGVPPVDGSAAPDGGSNLVSGRQGPGAGGEAATTDGDAGGAAARREHLSGSELFPIRQVPSRGWKYGHVSQSVPATIQPPVELVEEPNAALWESYRGQWGPIPAPIEQPWFTSAETPVSRSAFLRAFCQCWPETDHVYAA